MRLFLVLLSLTALSGPSSAQQLFRSAYALAEDVPLTADAAATAQAGSFSAATEPLAFHRNPALLAGVGRRGRAMAAVAGSRDVGFTSLAATTYGVAAGSDAVGGLPLAVGVAASRSTLNAGPQVWTDAEGNELGTIDNGDTAWSGAVGAGWSGPVEVDLGVALHRRAARPVVDVGGASTSRARGVTLDAGAVVTVPVFGRDGAAGPILDVSTGYVQRHVAITAARPQAWEATGRPSTVRTGTMGYGARAGLAVRIGGARVEAVVLDGRVEAEADLDRDDVIERRPDGSVVESQFVRDPLVGRMGAENALLGDRGDHVTGRRAWRLTLFDALSITRGHAERTSPWTSTWGLSVDAGGAVRLVGLASGAARLAQVGDRLTLRASVGVQSDSEGLYRSSYGGLTVGWHP